MVNHVPVLRSQVSPEGFEFVLAEQCVCDDMLVFHTFGEQEGSIGVVASYSFPSDGPFHQLEIFVPTSCVQKFSNILIYCVKLL